MSQFFIGVNSGNLPPEVPTSFTTDLDDTTLVAPTPDEGEAVPLNNVLRVAGDHGIKSIGFSNQDGLMGIRFIEGIDTTTDLQTTILITQEIPDDSAMTVNVLISGFADDGAAAGGHTIATVKNVLGTAIIVDQGDLTMNADDSLLSAIAGTDVSFQITASGANLVVSATGVAGRTISWTAILPGIAVGGQ